MQHDAEALSANSNGDNVWHEIAGRVSSVAVEDRGAWCVGTIGVGEFTDALAQVARVYETMKPEEAAVILTGLDSGTSTEILRRMPERAAARVMAAFDPAAAARFSESMLRP